MFFPFSCRPAQRAGSYDACRLPVRPMLTTCQNVNPLELHENEPLACDRDRGESASVYPIPHRLTTTPRERRQQSGREQQLAGIPRVLPRAQLPLPTTPRAGSFARFHTVATSTTSGRSNSPLDERTR